jgi:hypothetical protein
MRLLFICGCLEPGKDGVGDYTSRLAIECKNLGHEVAKMALNDGFIRENGINNGVIPVLRLPKSSNWKSKELVVINFINDFYPDWISLQFVPYAFHPKGFYFNSLFFETITKGFHLHVMFHELWVAEELGASLKMRITGIIQKWGILRLLKKLKPQIIHTSIPLYKEVLHHYHIASGILPLFGNIPFDENPDFKWLNEIISQKSTFYSSEKKSEFCFLGIFGRIYVGFDLEQIMNQIKNSNQLINKRIIVLSVGHLGSFGEEMFKQMQIKYPDIDFLVLGRQEEGYVSSFLQFIDIGIANTPKILLGKSGSFLAMKEHGLPVVCLDPAFTFHFDFNDLNDYPLLYNSAENLNTLGLNRERKKNESVKDVANQFINELNYKAHKLNK